MGRKIELDPSTFVGNFNTFFAGFGPLFLESYAQGRQPVDIAAQERWFEFLERHFPAIPIVSEEKHGDWPPKADEFWLLDPLDGTWNFLFGLPLFGTMLSLVRDGVVVFSTVFLPIDRALGRGGMYVASRGRGAWVHYPDGRLRQLHVSVVSALRDAFVVLGGLEQQVVASEPMRRVAIAAKENRRGLSTCWSLTRMVSGGLGAISADVWLNINCVPWDILHGCCFVEAAGGRATDFRGEALALENCREVVYSNGLLHEQVLEALQG